ncbi:LysR family transcriptional regulator [Vibrio sp. SCSIO 43136]|uniref:LysR family transcriptional regulator n=1 Tax=Vibrio sp. SCSIO 43136 TaxID=2819101 RepID=UPI002075942E|nr:LysR family transcriptional regulator [Vibrio sp. SCSIO 43136]USD67590.1 LysR family transcriptional regulator [Vibrio sp. SCSIO 43136]
MLGNINLNLLRSLIILLEECHVTRAAERLHISQSAVSRQLAQLRELCQDPLLVREGNHLIPTTKALALQDKLQALFGEFDSLLNDLPFDPSSYQGEIVFSSSDYVAQYVFPHIAKHLSELSPQLNIGYQLWEPSLIDKLNESGIDLASSMFPDKPKQVSSIELGSDYPVCVMANNHPLAHQDSISIEDMMRHAHIKVTGGADKDSLIDHQLAEQGCSRRIALRVPFFSTAMELLVNSEHLMIMQEHIATNLANHWAITSFPLPFSTQEQYYWLFWHPKFDNDPAHEYIRNEIVKVMGVCDYSI